MTNAAEFTELDQVAIMLMSLPKNESSQILKHLSPKEVEAITKSMVAMKNVDSKGVDSAITSFLETTQNSNTLVVKDEEDIRDVLQGALGEEKSENVVDTLLNGVNSNGLEALHWMPAKSIVNIIQNEHPQVQALVLSQLDPEISAQILMFFDERVRVDLIYRISIQEEVQPAALKELDNLINQCLETKPQPQPKKIGGTKTAADIINNLDTGADEDLIDGIKDKDEDLAEEIKDLMFVFENLLSIDDRGIQTLLREVSTDLLILALKSADPAIGEKIFSNMSKRAADLLRDDLEAKGPVKLSEVENAQKEILTIAKRLADSGEISLGGKGDEMV